MTVVKFKLSETNLDIHQNDVEIAFGFAICVYTLLPVACEMDLVFKFAQALVDDPAVDLVVLCDQHTHSISRWWFVGMT